MKRHQTVTSTGADCRPSGLAESAKTSGPFVCSSALLPSLIFKEMMTSRAMTTDTGAPGVGVEVYTARPTQKCISALITVPALAPGPSLYHVTERGPVSRDVGDSSSSHHCPDLSKYRTPVRAQGGATRSSLRVHTLGRPTGEQVPAVFPGTSHRNKVICLVCFIWDF